MTLHLLDDSLSVDVFYEPSDNQFNDNICVHICESCPEEEKVFIADEVNLYLTPEQARRLAEILLEASNASLSNQPASLQG